MQVGVLIDDSGTFGHFFCHHESGVDQVQIALELKNAFVVADGTAFELQGFAPHVFYDLAEAIHVLCKGAPLG
jgi:hypothetical protein